MGDLENDFRKLVARGDKKRIEKSVSNGRRQWQDCSDTTRKQCGCLRVASRTAASRNASRVVNEVHASNVARTNRSQKRNKRQTLHFC